MRKLEKGDLHQAFSHLSRRHTSSAAAFLASFFGCLAYLSFYMRNIRAEWPDQLTLLGMPFLVFLFFLVRYLSANIAFRKVSQEIRLCSHQDPTEGATCEHLTMDDYLRSKYTFWPSVGSVAYYAILFLFISGIIWFGLVFSKY